MYILSVLLQQVMDMVFLKGIVPGKLAVIIINFYKSSS